MTVSEFAALQDIRACDGCGRVGMVTERNPNNNGSEPSHFLMAAVRSVFTYRDGRSLGPLT